MRNDREAEQLAGVKRKELDSQWPRTVAQAVHIRWEISPSASTTCEHCGRVVVEGRYIVDNKKRGRAVRYFERDPEIDQTYRPHALHCSQRPQPGRPPSRSRYLFDAKDMQR